MEDVCSPGCGHCCAHQTIPVTILDLERIAEHMNLPPLEAFRRFVQKTFTGKRSTFILRKRANRTCVFLNEEAMCNIYEARPRICEFYHCSKNSESKFRQIIDHCDERELKRRVLEHAVSSSATTAYIDSVGLAWDASSWMKALAMIRKSRLIHRVDEFRITWRADGTPRISQIVDRLLEEEEPARKKGK
jgi:Fe-S-cluster containining protein